MKNCNYCEVVWNECLLLCQRYLDKAINIQPKINSLYSNLQVSREEYSINSRYLHRGVYCPSPDMEHIVTNMRRGKIAKRITKASRLTNRYLFDAWNKLRLAETLYPNGSTKREYIFYEDDVIYGTTFDEYGHVAEISIEQYVEGKIVSYLWASCCYEQANDCSAPSWILYETYNYDNEGYLDTEFYDMSIQNNFGRYYKYRFSLNTDGMIIPNSKVELMREAGRRQGNGLRG